MSEGTVVTQHERQLAGLAHGSIFLGFFTSGIGGHDFKYAVIGDWLKSQE